MKNGHCTNSVVFRSERQWRDIAFCLARMNYSEKGIRKLQDNFSCFNDKLGEDDVYSNFVSLLNGAKSFAKPETKVRVSRVKQLSKFNELLQDTEGCLDADVLLCFPFQALIEELEARVQQCHDKGVDDNAAVAKANVAKATKTRKGKAAPKTPGTTMNDTSEFEHVRRTLHLPLHESETPKRNGVSHLIVRAELRRQCAYCNCASKRCARPSNTPAPRLPSEMKLSKFWSKGNFVVAQSREASSARIHTSDRSCLVSQGGSGRRRRRSRGSRTETRTRPTSTPRDEAPRNPPKSRSIPTTRTATQNCSILTTKKVNSIAFCPDDEVSVLKT